MCKTLNFLKKRWPSLMRVRIVGNGVKKKKKWTWDHLEHRNHGEVLGLHSECYCSWMLSYNLWVHTDVYGHMNLSHYHPSPAHIFFFSCIWYTCLPYHLCSHYLSLDGVKYSKVIQNSGFGIRYTQVQTLTLLALRSFGLRSRTLTL